MKDKVQVHLKTHTVEDTQQFGQLLGEWVKHNGHPLCIALVGGDRKNTFVARHCKGLWGY